ncbi:MAG: hypothetical protein LUG16_06350 [Candidatus Gastranaerophilales bacterium]|nr:hypothetical protein [Candidatus Gastranaerophilales bacterium]
MEIASGAIPGFGVGGKATAGLAKAMAPKLGKLIAKETAAGLASGKLSGGVYGLGEGLINDENLLESMLKNAALGTAAGGIAGLGTGNFTKNLAKQEILNASNREPLLKAYAENYLDGLTNVSKEIGEFRRIKMGIKEPLIKTTLYDKIEKPIRKKSIWLSPEEYAMVISELNTNLTQEELLKKTVTKQIGNYEYVIEIYDFNEYRILHRRKLK